MASPLESAVAVAWSACNRAGGVSVAYSQGATTITASAVPGVAAIPSETIDGVIRTDNLHDFVFLTEDLMGLVPRRGDRVTWGTRLFEVVAPAGLRQYEFGDPYEITITVHCKEIAAS